ncbi:MAG: hypothetical protein A2202_05770 [Bdellovibrionales bacterium RIFOXYA1_FULL_36_14]|nr:MAG: hypothetical protein A2202_05770 [Bdellovibrionales bacterium RIFOXYA1_FULL_36_14]
MIRFIVFPIQILVFLAFIITSLSYLPHSWALEERIIIEKEILDESGNQYIETHYKLPERKLVFREKIQIVNGKKITQFQYKFEKEKLLSIDYLNEFSQITKRLVINHRGHTIEEISYLYRLSSDNHPYAFVRKNAIFDFIIANYNNTNLAFELKNILSNESESEILRKIEIAHDPSRTLVAIIDSGVDHTHPDIAYKFMINFADKIDDIDNDINGLTDDFIGWSIPLQKGLPVEKINPSSETIPLSHGTHVADIMLKNIDQAMLLPFTGDYGESHFLDLANRKFQTLKPVFANLSFLFPHWSLQEIPKETYFSLQNLIKNNPDTLFFTAAGNDFGRELVSGRNGLYPASFEFNNIITVGALDTNEIIEDEMDRYQIAPYSNVGIEHVDILAPGSDIEAASLGGKTIRHTGTSMASPFALNIALKIKLNFPKLTGQEIKNILLFSAYIPDIDKPFKVRCGGMIFPRRAMEIAKRYSNLDLITEYKNIRHLAKEIRFDPSFSMPNESTELSYFQKLDLVWNKI